MRSSSFLTNPAVLRSEVPRVEEGVVKQMPALLFPLEKRVRGIFTLNCTVFAETKSPRPSFQEGSLAELYVLQCVCDFRDTL
jgi:hypothetical protein